MLTVAQTIQRQENEIKAAVLRLVSVKISRTKIMKSLISCIKIFNKLLLNAYTYMYNS